MRGTTLVLTIAFVFASTGVLLSQVAGQQTDPMPPEECCQQPPQDATVAGIVRDQDGKPLSGVSVSANSYGPIYYAEGDTATSSEGSSGSGSSGSGIARPCCYSGGYNSTVTGQDGRYSMGISSGDLSVSVYLDGYASTSAQVHVESGQTGTQDFDLKAFPAKTAHIEGRITDAKSGKGLGFASLSLRSPLYGIYECSTNGESPSPGSPEPASEPASADSKIAAMPYYDPGCALLVHPDGTYSGDVTPGYTILSVYAWQDCSTSRDADGSSSTSCGPEYLGWTRTMSLPENKTTKIDIALPSRASPDATVSGYLIDAETGRAIPGATISFSNQETYAYGSATTDQDGSYSLRLRAGYHMVSVYAPDHLSWEGTLSVPKGSSPFDVKLTPGQEAGGGCCYAYGGVAMSKGAAAPTAASGGGSADGNVATSEQAAGGNAGAVQYQDLGGHLGPYDAAERADALANDDGSAPSTGSKGSPGAGVLLTAGALGALALVLRRRNA